MRLGRSLLMAGTIRLKPSSIQTRGAFDMWEWRLPLLIKEEIKNKEETSSVHIARCERLTTV